jgi:hypothetical protein
MGTLNRAFTKPRPGNFMRRLALMIMGMSKGIQGPDAIGKSNSKYAQLNPNYSPHLGHRRKLKGYQKQGLRSFNKNK